MVGADGRGETFAAVVTAPSEFTVGGKFAACAGGVVEGGGLVFNRGLGENGDPCFFLFLSITRYPASSTAPTTATATIIQ